MIDDDEADAEELAAAMTPEDLKAMIERQKHYDAWMRENGSDDLEPTSQAMWDLHNEYLRLFP